jgi:hypothetical protein
VENDIAFLVLQKDFSKAYARIANNAPPPGAKSIAVGLGLNNDYSWQDPDGSTDIGSPRRLNKLA